MKAVRLKNSKTQKADCLSASNAQADRQLSSVRFDNNKT